MPTQNHKLILTVGLPRSGKSEWAKTTGLPIVSPDAIRLALHGQRFLAMAEPFVWAITYLMVHALFLAGCPCVIVDATNTTAARRDAWEKKGYDIGYQVFTTSVATCIERAIATEQQDLIPVIERMAAEWDLPGHPLDADRSGHA